jgi:chromosome segregation ATPase
MVIDTEINIGGSKKPPLLPTKPRVVAVNLHGDEMRHHEQIMKYRRRVNEINSNLVAAMASLEFANKDIDRLNAEVESLKDALKKERDKNARLSKKQKASEVHDEQSGAEEK